jgi:ATP-dependent Clp protease protease subunit
MGVFMGIKRILLAFLLCLGLMGASRANKAPPVTDQDGVITLTSGNSIALRTEVSSESVSKLIDQIFRIPATTIYMYIDSPGGDIISGMKLMDTMKASGKHFVCIANAAASMAFSILQACDERLVTEPAILMQHMGAFELYGQAPNNNSMNTFAQKLFRYLNKKDAERLGMSQKDFYQKIRNDWWLFGDEAIKVNAADRVTQVRCSNELTEKIDVQSIDFLFVSLKVKMSGCPIAEGPLAIEVKRDPRHNDRESEERLRVYLKTLSPHQYLLERFSHRR